MENSKLLTELWTAVWIVNRPLQRKLPKRNTPYSIQKSHRTICAFRIKMYPLPVENSELLTELWTAVWIVNWPLQRKLSKRKTPYFIHKYYRTLCTIYIKIYPLPVKNSELLTELWTAVWIVNRPLQRKLSKRNTPYSIQKSHRTLCAFRSKIYPVPVENSELFTELWTAVWIVNWLLQRKLSKIKPPYFVRKYYRTLCTI